MPFWQFFRKGWDGRALLVRPSKMHHRMWKNLFVLGADEYLKRLEAKLERAYSFMLKYSKITVWMTHQDKMCADSSAANILHCFGPSCHINQLFSIINQTYWCMRLAYLVSGLQIWNHTHHYLLVFQILSILY